MEKVQFQELSYKPMTVKNRSYKSKLSYLFWCDFIQIHKKNVKKVSKNNSIFHLKHNIIIKIGV